MKPVLLHCFLSKKGDYRNLISLTDEYLIITFKDISIDISIKKIEYLGIQRKKLNIPLIMGGIGTSFSLLAYWLGWYHHEINLMIVFLFFGWMYYGFLGRDALVVRLGEEEQFFLLGAKTDTIHDAVIFIKERLWKLQSPTDAVVFHLTTTDIWNKQLELYQYEHPTLHTEGFIHGSDFRTLITSYQKHFSLQTDVLLVAINPKWVLSEIKYEWAEKRKSKFPHIYGKLNKSAILGITEVSDEADIQEFLDTFR